MATFRKKSVAIKNCQEKLKIEARERKKNILYLILSYLRENYLEKTVEILLKEAQQHEIDENQFELCENVDLDIILQEYQSYYYTKFQKFAKIVRKTSEKTNNKTILTKNCNFRKNAATMDNKEEEITDDDEEEEPKELEKNNLEFKITQLSRKPENSAISSSLPLLKWTDCIGLEEPIEILKETAIYPQQYAEIFRHIQPWKGILFYGPPGTGKTLLAKTFAEEISTNFFNISSSSIISKWRGESEILLKKTVDDALCRAPSTIFFDEIDSLVPASKVAQDHEAARRFRGEFLVQMDKLRNSDQIIHILAATNAPWDLDAAILRRFDKRIYVTLPACVATRQQILRRYLQQCGNVAVNFNVANVANCVKEEEFLHGYSGSDIRNVAKEVQMNLARKQMRELKLGKKNISTSPQYVVDYEDVRLAVEKVKSTASFDKMAKEKFENFQKNYGSI